MDEYGCDGDCDGAKSMSSVRLCFTGFGAIRLWVNEKWFALLRRMCRTCFSNSLIHLLFQSYVSCESFLCRNKTIAFQVFVTRDVQDKNMSFQQVLNINMLNAFMCQTFCSET